MKKRKAIIEGSEEKRGGRTEEEGKEGEGERGER